MVGYNIVRVKNVELLPSCICCSQLPGFAYCLRTCCSEGDAVVKAGRAIAPFPAVGSRSSSVGSDDCGECQGLRAWAGIRWCIDCCQDIGNGKVRRRGRGRNRIGIRRRLRVRICCRWNRCAVDSNGGCGRTGPVSVNCIKGIRSCNAGDTATVPAKGTTPTF